MINPVFKTVEREKGKHWGTFSACGMICLTPPPFMTWTFPTSRAIGKMYHNHKFVVLVQSHECHHVGNVRIFQPNNAIVAKGRMFFSPLSLQKLNRVFTPAPAWSGRVMWRKTVMLFRFNVWNLREHTVELLPIAERGTLANIAVRIQNGDLLGEGRRDELVKRNAVVLRERLCAAAE